MSNSLTISGTANFRAIDEASFSVAMTGTFDGGVYAKGVWMGQNAFAFFDTEA